MFCRKSRTSALMPLCLTLSQACGSAPVGSKASASLPATATWTSSVQDLAQTFRAGIDKVDLAALGSQSVSSWYHQALAGASDGTAQIGDVVLAGAGAQLAAQADNLAKLSGQYSTFDAWMRASGADVGALTAANFPDMLQEGVAAVNAYLAAAEHPTGPGVRQSTQGDLGLVDCDKSFKSTVGCSVAAIVGLPLCVLLPGLGCILSAAGGACAAGGTIAGAAGQCLPSQGGPNVLP